MARVILIFLACCTLAGAAARTDQATGLIFPEDINRWAFSDYKAYEPIALGVSYSYKSKLQRLGAVSCYIYSKGLSVIPTGGDSPELQKEMAEVAWAVGEGWKRRGATVEEVMPVSALRTEDGRVLALLCGHRITHDGVTNISISALAGFKNHFLKIRFTFPGNDLQAALTGLGGLGEFAAEMRKLNKDTLDPLFLTDGATKLEAKP